RGTAVTPSSGFPSPSRPWCCFSSCTGAAPTSVTRMSDVNETLRMNRLKLVLVAGVFLLPMIVAGILGGLGWSPGTRSHGEPIRPQRSFDDVRIAMDDGGRWAWRDSDKPRMT